MLGVDASIFSQLDRLGPDPQFVDVTGPDAHSNHAVDGKDAVGQNVSGLDQRSCARLHALDASCEGTYVCSFCDGEHRACGGDDHDTSYFHRYHPKEYRPGTYSSVPHHSSRH